MHEKTIDSEIVYQGCLFKVERLQVELEDGTRSQREIVRHPGAVAVVVRNGDRFIFVRQYRKAVEKLMIEVVAGTREPGEDAEACARREVEEETGHAVQTIEHLGDIYPTPGYLEEKINVFAATAVPVENARSQDVDERVEAYPLTAEEFTEMVRTNQIQDAKTMGCWALAQLKWSGMGNGA